MPDNPAVAQPTETPLPSPEPEAVPDDSPGSLESANAIPTDVDSNASPLDEADDAPVDSTDEVQDETDPSEGNRQDLGDGEDPEWTTGNLVSTIEEVTLTDGSEQDDTEVLLAELVEAPLDIEAAEIDTGAKVLEEALASNSAEEWILNGVPKGFSWIQAKRMQLLFRSDTSQIKSAYETLRETQVRALRLERKHQKAMLKHDLINADQADDLSGVKEDIARHQELLKRLNSDTKHLRQRIRQCKAELLSPLYKPNTWIWPKKKDHDIVRSSDLQTQLKNLEGQISDTTDRLNSLEPKKTKIQGPLEAAEAENREFLRLKVAAGETVDSARQSINQQILVALKDIQLQDGSETLNALMKYALQPMMLMQCVRELNELQSAASRAESERKATESLLNQQNKKVNEASNDLGSAIADGFEHLTRQRNTKVQVDCSVRFRKTTDWKAGVKHISGSAKGKANVSTTYEVDEIVWKRENRVEKCLSLLGSNLQQMGKAHAEETLQTAEAQAAQRTILDCVTYIRLELERDFGDS